jgi:hypothetical protein
MAPTLEEYAHPSALLLRARYLEGRCGAVLNRKGFAILPASARTDSRVRYSLPPSETLQSNVNRVGR